MYTGQADWTLIGAVKNNPRMHIPIIGNGDITTGEEARRAFDTYGVDAVMVGRATIGQPWIFEQMRHYLTTGEQLPMRAKRYCASWWITILLSSTSAAASSTAAATSPPAPSSRA